MSRLSSPAGLHNEPETLNERVVTLSSGTTALTREEHANRLLLIGTVDAPYTLNLPHANGSGDVYEFMLTGERTSGSVIINATHGVSSNAFRGLAFLYDNSSGVAVQHFVASNGTAMDRITLNNTTTGAAQEGDYIKLMDIAVGRWQVIDMRLTNSGAQATPFSAP